MEEYLQMLNFGRIFADAEVIGD